jgi:exodeoxyribonuclease VII large subunit
MLREIRASAKRGLSARASLASTHALVLSRKHEAFDATLGKEARRLEALVLAERAHDPDRTLERGYALVTGEDGDPLGSAAATRERERVVMRFADGSVPARPEDRDPDG